MPAAISPASRPAVRQDGDDYVVVGQKVWSTWAQWADYGYLLARTEPVEGAGGITAFILDMHTPGVDVRPFARMTGTTDFNEVFLDEVRVPAANIIGAPGEGWQVAGASLAEERTGVGQRWWSGADPVRRLVDLARRHQRGGRPALEDGAVRQQLGDLAARARIQRHLGQRMATKAARGEITAADAPLVKIWWSELNLEMAEAALALLGVPFDGDGGRRAQRGRWALAGHVPLRSGVHDRRRVERDHAQHHRRAGARPASGAEGQSKGQT